MNDLDLAAILDQARLIAKDAADLVMSGYRTGTEIHKKGRIDLVTKYDLDSEALIMARLQEAFPQHKIIGEEGTCVGEGDLIWFVDPLDGTTNFAHGHPFFAVSIGLCDGPTPIAGVVAAPALGVTWSAARGQGAFRDADPCKVSTQSDLLDALAATGYAYVQDTDDDNVRETRTVLKKTHGFRRCGSAAIDLAMVSDGTYDFYWEQRLNPWDLAAGACCVLEAGGVLSDYDGSESDLRTGRLVASNPHLHAQAIDLIQSSRTDID